MFSIALWKDAKFMPSTSMALPASSVHRILAPWNTVLITVDIAVHLAVACDVYDGVFLCCPFSHEMSWRRS